MSHDHSQTATRMPPPAHQTAAGRSGASGVQASPEDAVLRRTPDGWRVGAEDVPDLTCAMVLADLLAAELAADESAEHAAALEQDEKHPDGQQADGKQADGKQADDVQPDGTSAGESAADEARRLKATVGQLQHALTARIRVEQAIGVLAERHRIRPRQAFEQLRSAARNRGRRVADIAADVVASASNPLLQLPDELARTRSGSRSGRQRRLVDPEA
jgi:ANTAR domain